MVEIGVPIKIHEVELDETEMAPERVETEVEESQPSETQTTPERELETV